MVPWNRKTFLYRALFAIRTKGCIALATATSSCRSLQYFQRRTNVPFIHAFKIPIDIDENFTCNISKQSSLA
ncbi:hypothetical protein H5410_059350 [Solanum commersonii]|uniref:ATP-dependent DNA helicase n=1 Tax=Solanum commersonii TaxID=4109 RepID=A0A9J5W2M3_SOLCO|nr:hypothetical protein H5410_059350 [Solanum commersonii]